MSLPHDYESIWLKAKSFINRSFDSRDSGDEPLAKLWAAVSLELLAKAALCHISPLLIADPSDDGNSLMIAAGLPGDTSKYRSVSAKTIYSRCARAFRNFDRDWAMSIAQERNAELHSGAASFAEIEDDDRWWERFWWGVEILLSYQSKALDDFVGFPRTTEVQERLEQNSANTKARVESRMAAARHNLQIGYSSKPTITGFYEFSQLEECPVCQSNGELLGDYIEESIVASSFDWHDELPTEEVTIWTEAFACEECGLELRGEDQVAAANLPDTFVFEREYEPDYSDFYGND